MKRLLPASSNSSSFLSALTGRACRRVGIVAFLTILVLEVVVMLPSFHGHRDEFAEVHAAEAATLFKAAVDPSRYPSIELLAKLGEDLTRTTKITGGILISGAGETRASFGDPPQLSWIDARLNGETARLHTEDGLLDVFIPSETTGLPYGVILRADVHDDMHIIDAHTIDRAKISVVIALVLSLVTMLVVAKEVVQPLAKVRETVDLALNAPDTADGWRTGVSRSDEIGELARSVDQLLFFISATFSDELAASLAIIESSPHGILVFSQHGHLISANHAALELFGENDFDELLRRDPSELFRFQGETVDATELIKYRAVLGNGEIISSAGDFPCLIAGDTVKNPSGTVLRQFLMFVDMRSLVEDVRNEVRRREEAELHAKEIGKASNLLRRLFDACLVVTELDNPSALRSSAVSVVPGGLINAWKHRVEKENEIEIEDLSADELPTVLGDPVGMRKVFDTALEIIRLRSENETPAIHIGTSVNDKDIATFTIREHGEDDKTTIISSGIDVALLIGALGVLCKGQSGLMVAASGEEEANMVVFRLKIDRTTVDSLPPSETEAA